ncbi:hypothetical protein FRB91_011663 [Serendipita sp. 411]|nr:hypothetical protein FRB91_011663 [Serendipita sp. 411]
MQAVSLPLALLALLVEFVNAVDVNVIVDDHDEQIQYTGNLWSIYPECNIHPVVANASLLQNGTLHLVNGTNSGISFNFTGVAVSVQGIIPQQEWQGRGLPNVTFDLDGLTVPLSVMVSQGQSDVLYNQTLFQAKDLPDGPHTLVIRTRNNATFILDSIIYTSTLVADVGIVNATSTSLPPESTFPYEEAGPPSSSPNTTLVGAIVGAIFGTFLLVGVFGLLVLRRTGRARRRKRSTANRAGVVGGANQAGGRNKPSSGSGSGGQGKVERSRSRGNQPEYKYSGPKQLNIPLGQPNNNRSSKWHDPTKSSGGIRSAIGTFVSRSSSDSRSMGGAGTDYVHAITTDVPQFTTRVPMEWGQRAKADKHASVLTQGSTLEADGVLERMMMHSTSSHAGSPGSNDFDYSIPSLSQYQQSPQPHIELQPQTQHPYVVDHPFKASVPR